MKTSAYQQQYANRFFRTVLITVMVFLGIYSSMAQFRTRVSNIKYKAFEASFGTRSFQVNSNIKKIDGMKAGHEGGSLGIILGNDVLISRIKVGYFSSDSNTPHTQEIFESSFQMNLYPLSFLTTQARVRPYLTAGLTLDRVKYYGYYLDQDNASIGAYEPLLAKVSQFSLTGGAGVGYNLSRNNDFISVFAEMNAVLPMTASANRSAFNQTSISRFTSFSVGVRFGMNSKSNSRSAR